MQTIWPAYEGSVRTSWYPVIAVLNTTSPSPITGAPSGVPTKARPSSSTSAAWVGLTGNDHRLVDPILVGNEHLDALAVRRGHVLTHVVGTDRHLAVAAVQQDRELDRPRAAEVHQRVHRRARRTPVVDDVVDEDDDLVVDRGKLARARAPVGRPQMEIVAVLGHVEAAGRHRRTLELRQGRGQAPRDHVALADDADEDYVLDP